MKNKKYFKNVAVLKVQNGFEKEPGYHDVL